MAGRVGIGFDSHPLVDGRPLVLGGVEVPFYKGLEGHSDGDVLVHAIMDALLGAAGLGDKGAHFPSSDPKYKGISSLSLLSKVAELVYNEGSDPGGAGATGWRISNVDATILAQRPVLGPFIKNMKQKIAITLSIPEHRANIKATTTDYLGFVGQEEGMAAYAVTLLEDKV